MKRMISLALLLASLLGRCNNEKPATETASSANPSAVSEDGFDRTVLPISPSQIPAISIEDAREAKAPAPWEVKASKGAPNVILVLVDDKLYQQACNEFYA